MMNASESPILQSGAAILAGIGILPADAQPLTRPGFADRELIISVSSGFARQTWVRDGRVFHETRDTLSLTEGEIVRITIANDMPGIRVITVGDGRMLRLASGQSGSIDVAGKRDTVFAIEVVGQPALSRPVKVHPKGRIRVRAA